MTSKERFWKAVHLEEPDRVPISPYIVFFAASLADMTPAEFGWSVEKSHQALFKTYQYFDKEIDALNIQSMRFAHMDVFPSPYSVLYFDWEFRAFRFHPSISRVAPLHRGAIRYYKEKGLLK